MNAVRRKSIAPSTPRRSATSDRSSNEPMKPARAWVALWPRSLASSKGARSSTSRSTGMPGCRSAPTREMRMRSNSSTRNAAGRADVIVARWCWRSSDSVRDDAAHLADDGVHVASASADGITLPWRHGLEHGCLQELRRGTVVLRAEDDERLGARALAEPFGEQAVWAAGAVGLVEGDRGQGGGELVSAGDGLDHQLHFSSDGGIGDRGRPHFDHVHVVGPSDVDPEMTGVRAQGGHEVGPHVDDQRWSVVAGSSRLVHEEP